MKRQIIILSILSLMVSACTNISVDGVYVIDKEKLKHNITNAKNYVADRETERILREIDNSELTLIIKHDSVQIVSSGQTATLNNKRYRFTPIKSGVKFAIEISDGAFQQTGDAIFQKTDSCYLLSINNSFGPSERIEFVKVGRKEEDEYLMTLHNKSTAKAPATQVGATEQINISAFLIYNDGTLSDFDLVKEPEGSLWNVYFGEGDKKPSVKTRVILTGSLSNMDVEIKIDDIVKFSKNGIQSNKGFEVDIDGTGCGVLSIQVKKNNAQINTEKIVFGCGE